MSESKRMSLAQARVAVAKKWDSHHANWLIGALNAPCWPLAFSLHSLTEKDVLRDLPGTREWVSHWRHWNAAAGTIAWMLTSPSGFPSGAYVKVRVIVNGVEAPPGWWVLIP